MSKNFKLMFDTLHYIWKHPEEWDQRWWMCGTAMCFAGRAVDLAGYRMRVVGVHDPDEDLPEIEVVGLTDAEGGEITDVSLAADHLLGLPRDDYQSWCLYRPANTLRDLFAEVERMASNDGVALPDWFAEGKAESESLECAA